MAGGFETSGLAQEVGPGAVTPCVGADGKTVYFEHRLAAEPLDVDASGFVEQLTGAPAPATPPAEVRIAELTGVVEHLTAQNTELRRVNRNVASAHAIGNFAMQMRAKAQQMHGVIAYLADPANEAPKPADWQRLLTYTADASFYDAEFLPWPETASGQHQQVKA